MRCTTVKIGNFVAIVCGAKLPPKAEIPPLRRQGEPGELMRASELPPPDVARCAQCERKFHWRTLARLRGRLSQPADFMLKCGRCRQLTKVHIEPRSKP